MGALRNSQISPFRKTRRTHTQNPENHDRTGFIAHRVIKHAENDGSNRANRRSENSQISPSRKTPAQNGKKQHEGGTPPAKLVPYIRLVPGTARARRNGKFEIGSETKKL